MPQMPVSLAGTGCRAGKLGWRELGRASGTCEAVPGMLGLASTLPRTAAPTDTREWGLGPPKMPEPGGGGHLLFGHDGLSTPLEPPLSGMQQTVTHQTRH